MSSQRRGPWSQREDEHLQHLVQSQGPLNWVRISQQIQTRTPKQCRERYHQNLKPSLNHDPITAEEGALIEKLVAQIGKRWAEIARRLNNRSDNAVKNWWNGSMNRRKRMVRRKIPDAYDDHNTDLSYSRLPAPLRLPTMPQYVGYHQYGPVSPSATRFTHHPPWATAHSGLPSPSTTSPGADSLDGGAPSLMSDAGSAYSTSPTTAGPYPDSPVALPPLRFGDADSPTSQTFGPSPELPPIGFQHEQLRLPSIRECVDDLAQLPTAPNSPFDRSQRPPRPMLQMPAREESSKKKDPRMKLGSLLS